MKYGALHHSRQAKRVSNTIRFNLIALMTAAYGIKQIVGPLLTSYLYSKSGTFTSSLVAAALALIFSTLLTLRLPRFQLTTR